MFKGLKSVGRLHHLPSSKDVVVKALILAALLYVMLSGWLKKALGHMKALTHVGLLRWLMILREWCETLLRQLGELRPRYKRVNDLELFIEQLSDPNKVRSRSLLTPCIVDHYP